MAASCAENLVSLRSKLTIGLRCAMYSMTLIQVDTLLSGLEGSGSTQISAAARFSNSSRSGMKPVNSIHPLRRSWPAKHRKSGNESPSPMMTQ